MAANRPRWRSRPQASIGIAPAVLVRSVRAVPAIAPHQVVVGIERVVAVDAVADLEIHRGYPSAVDEMVRVALPRRIACAHARAHRLFARFADEHDFTRKHVDELIFERVPVAKRRLPAGTERDSIDAELGETADVAQAALDSVT